MYGDPSSERPYTRQRTRWRSALLLAVVALPAACTDTVAGTPEGAAGFGPVSSPDQPEPQRRLDGVDTCALLTPMDLEGIGGVDGEPQRNALLPQSCVYELAGGAPGDVAAVAFYKPLDQAREQAPGGTLVDTAGYPTWLFCGVDDGYQTCSAAVTVRPERTLLVLLSRRDVSDVAVRGDLEVLTHTVLARLPAE